MPWRAALATLRSVAPRDGQRVRSYFGPIPRLRGFDYKSPRSYFITFCTWQRQTAFADSDLAIEARDIITRYRSLGWYYLMAFCVMPDHVHLLIRLRDNARSVSRIVATIKNEISKCVRQRGKLLVWQKGFFDRVIRAVDKPGDIARYVLENPVRAELVRFYSDYRFSGAPDLR